MTVDLPAPAERLGRPWWSVLRVAVLAMWLVAASVGWWSAPRQAGCDEAKAAVAERRLTAYQWGDSWDTNHSGPWFDRSTLRSAGTQGPIFAWRTGDGRVRWADTDDFGDVALTGVVEKNRYAGPGAAAVAEELVAAGLEDRAGEVDDRNPWVIDIGLALALVFLTVVAGGPAPVRGTRWYWFWLTCTAPYGLGLVFWLFRDRPWARAGGAGGIEPRDRGWHGLLLGVLVSILVSALLVVLKAGQ